MSTVLFTHSYFLSFDAKQSKAGKPYAPIGTLYAAAFIREQGYAVSFFDTMFCKSTNPVAKEIVNQQPKYFVIYDDGFNYLTKMCLTNMRTAAYEMIRVAKLNNCVVIVSSSDSTDHYADYLKSGADYVLIGEAELTLLSLLNKLNENAASPSSVSGIAYLENDQVIKTPRRPVLTDLDTIPFPAWDLIDMTPYRLSWMKNAGYFSINVSTTRGCPFHCNWCAKPIYGNRYNSRSPQNVVAELQFLKERFQFNHVWFCDDIFGLKKGWVNEFANILADVGLSLNYKIQSRADLLIQENYVAALAKSGCTNVWMGAESGSQKILDAMDKGIKVEEIYSATSLLKKHNIHPCFFIQFGYPGELKEDIALTIKMIKDLLPFEIGISVSYPLPGTAFFEKVKSELLQKSNWVDSDELALMFTNTYPPAFYKQLHGYVHKTYLQQIAAHKIKQIFSGRSKIDWQFFKKAASYVYYLPQLMAAKIKLSILEKV